MSLKCPRYGVFYSSYANMSSGGDVSDLFGHRNCLKLRFPGDSLCGLSLDRSASWLLLCRLNDVSSTGGQRQHVARLHVGPSNGVADT